MRQRLATRRRERLNALETLNRIIARFDGSQSVPGVIQAVVTDIARSFELPLVSLHLPIAGDRLTMAGVAGYDDSFPEIDLEVGIIGRAATTRQTQFVGDVLADPDYRAARPDVRSEVAAPVVYGDELVGVINFEGTAERPIGPAQVALAEMVVNGLSAALRSARLDDERRDRLRAIERVLAVSREVVADLDRPRLVASVVDVVAELLTADVVALISRGADGAYRVEAGRGFPPEAIGMKIKPGEGLFGRCIAERARMVGRMRWPSGRPSTEPRARAATRLMPGLRCRSWWMANCRRSWLPAGSAPSGGTPISSWASRISSRPRSPSPSGTPICMPASPNPPSAIL